MERLQPVYQLLLPGLQDPRGLTDDHTGVFFFFGGVLMIIGSVMEWIVGNTFPFVVFGTFGESALFAHPTFATGLTNCLT